jgi:hypothetical protein
MSAGPEFDRIAEAWLAAGPTGLADRVLDAALLEIHSTRQRRRPALPWRTPTMNTPLRLAVAIAIVAVVGVAGLSFLRAPSAGPGAVLAPSASPTAAPTATPVRITPKPTPEPTPVPVPSFDSTFASPLMGYSVRYPSGWTTTPATSPWTAGTGDGWDAPNGDQVEGAGTGFRGGSQPLAPGQTAQAWIDAYVATQVTDCGVREQIPLAGTQATIDLNGCPALGRLQGRIYDVVLVVGDRGYNFTMEGQVDRAYLLEMLSTIEFDPASAAD